MNCFVYSAAVLDLEGNRAMQIFKGNNHLNHEINNTSLECI